MNITQDIFGDTAADWAANEIARLERAMARYYETGKETYLNLIEDAEICAVNAVNNLTADDCTPAERANLERKLNATLDAINN